MQSGDRGGVSLASWFLGHSWDSALVYASIRETDTQCRWDQPPYGQSHSSWIRLRPGAKVPDYRKTNRFSLSP
ncbi:hypothetical protein DPEC_G00254360 [Dallia pectoralis]|uniref:Uncharacterized protein n=1 Tax=Dallia pectoralis TaxID=75939 RepID=A0ACC2FUJ2_DALPE|nr:hypothetical protein DPEC_G00254360 [Dallia pectoralis]